MNAHKCDGCRYKGEHVEMGFKPFGVCYKETNLIEAEKNYNAEICPYKQALPQPYKTEPEDAPQPLPEQLDTVEDAFEKFAERLKEAFAPFLDILTQCVKTVTEQITALIPHIDNALKKIIDLYPNKRVIYLAKHGKGRTKKKNINRILKWYNQQAKTQSAKRSSRGYIKYIERDGRTLAVFAQD